MNMNPPFGRALACERAAQAISLRLDEELSELEIAQLRVHLDACPACRLLEQDMVGMTLEVRLMPLAVPSRQFTVPRMRAARMRSFRPLVATAARSAATIAPRVGSGLPIPATVERSRSAAKCSSERNHRSRLPSHETHRSKVR